MQNKAVTRAPHTYNEDVMLMGGTIVQPEHSARISAKMYAHNQEITEAEMLNSNCTADNKTNNGKSACFRIGDL